MSAGRRGFSMVETMVAIALLGVIVVTVLGAFSTVALATNRHRQETDLDRLARSNAEYIKAQPYTPKPAAYANLVAPGYGFATQVFYYNPVDGTFRTTNAENNLQEVALTVLTNSGAVSEQITFLKVQP